VFLWPEDASDFYKTFANIIEPIGAKLTSDPGPWNHIFLSTWYRMIVWFIFALNVIIVLYAFQRLLRLTSSGMFQLDLRTVVFLLGLFSSIAYITACPMRLQTYVRYNIEQVSTFLYSIAFYLLLLLWSGILARIQVSRAFVPFRITVYL